MSFREDIFPFKEESIDKEDLFLPGIVDTTNSSIQNRYNVRADVSIEVPEENNMVPTANSDGDFHTKQLGSNQEYEVISEMENLVDEVVEQEVDYKVNEALPKPVVDTYKNQTSSSVGMRKSARGVKPAIWLKDYVTT